MKDEKLPLLENLQLLGCKNIQEQNGHVRFELPKSETSKEMSRSITVPVENLNACVYALEQVFQFHRLPFTIDFEIKVSDKYVSRGMRGMQIRYKIDPKLSTLWSQVPTGWVKDGSDLVKNMILHQGTQPEHLFSSVLPEWLTTLASELLYKDEGFKLGEVIDDLKGVRYNLTTGMRHNIFMSGVQAYDPVDISNYFSSTYSNELIS